MRQLRSKWSLTHQLAFILGFFPSVARLAKLAKSCDADVIYSNSMYSLYGPWAARLARLPHICHVREIPGAPTIIRNTIIKSMVGGSAETIAMTNATAAGLGQRFASDPRVHVIPDGIDLTAFNPSVSGARVRRTLGIGPDDVLVGFVARLDPWKGADLFLRAAALIAGDHPAAHFLICGGVLPGYEAYARSTERLSRDLGLEDRAHFTGWEFKLDDIPEVMASLDVFVHCSIRPEPFGLVLVEAMATGTPLVASCDGGVPEVVINGETGILFPPEDEIALAAAVSLLLSDKGLRVETGRAGRAHVEKYFEVGGYARRVGAVIDQTIAAGGIDRQ
jgi:glycosyltransferase involved in cell wall biosynthesis